MRWLWMGLALSACDVPGPDAAGPALLTATGRVSGASPGDEVQMTWYVNARPNESILWRAERAPLDAQGNFRLPVRTFPPEASRFPATEGTATTARVAIGFVDLVRGGASSDLVAVETTSVTTYLALLFEGTPPPESDLVTGWNLVQPYLDDEPGVQPVRTEVFGLRLRARPAEVPELVPCGTLGAARSEIVATQADAEAAFEDEAEAFCADEEDDRAGLYSCVNVRDYLCEAECTLELWQLAEDEPTPFNWPCGAEGRPCTPGEAGEQRCRLEDEREVRCNPDTLRWDDAGPCSED